jgi:hypothetical protein
MADSVALSAAASGPNPLSAKLSQVLGTSYTDYAFKTAVEALGDTYTQNSPSARRQLRSRLEFNDLQRSGALLLQYENVIAVANFNLHANESH